MLDLQYYRRLKVSEGGGPQVRAARTGAIDKPLVYTIEVLQVRAVRLWCGVSHPRTSNLSN